jgi:signal transduction histidine kinase
VRRTRWIAAWLALSVLASTLLVRIDIAARREAFQNSARTAHRLLGQRAAQHDAILATLMLMRPESAPDDPTSRLPALYPQILQVLRRAPGQQWPHAEMARAERESRGAQRAALAAVEAAAGRFDLVRAGDPTSFALRIELEPWVPWFEWPFDRAGAVKADLVLGAAALPMHSGVAPSGWRGGVTPGFVFEKALDTPSQPFVLRLQRATGPADWPWAGMLALTVAIALLTAASAAVQRQRAARRRAERLLRLARTSRLNTMGELAAGMAHELNQPLTAVMASTQAARRMLQDDPLPLATLDEALGQARDQARRAADVVARLRRLVDRPGGSQSMQSVSLGDAARDALALLQPEWQRLLVRPEIRGEGVVVRADPVALDQILHNLLSNALQAMADVPVAQRLLSVSIGAREQRGVLRLRDGGRGLAPEVLDRLFEPFNSTRADGLGLGLSLCHSLATAMSGSLSAQNVLPHGAEFTLELPRPRP